MLASTCLTEESVEGAICPNDLVTWHLTIWLDAVFQATELPADTANMDTSLANKDGDAFMHGCCFVVASRWQRGRGEAVASYSATLR